MKQLFNVPFDITAVRFDRFGNSVPSRVQFRGMSCTVQQSEASALLSFCCEGSYFWLVKRRSSWQLLNQRASNFAK